MRVEEFDYHLPDGYIAQEPINPRDASRLLVLDRSSGRTEHRVFREIVSYLDPGDCLVLNDTRVMRARLFGRHQDTGGRVEVFLLRPVEEGIWEVLVRPGRRARVGTTIIFGGGELKAEVLERTDYGGRMVRFTCPSDGLGNLDEALKGYGEVPLPPYIKKPLQDAERYQTVYADAQKEKSVAAPTAGLHFTRRLLRQLQARGVRMARVTLHVGLGTFRPVQVEKVEDHRMHEEFYSLDQEACDLINLTRKENKRVVAVGTTVVRTLETVGREGGELVPGHGSTDLFIYPGYHFRVVDALVTNFHLPRSTLLMLVCAFAGRGQVLSAYQEAVREGYRFYSFGDAMLIL